MCYVRMYISPCTQDGVCVLGGFPIVHRVVVTICVPPPPSPLGNPDPSAIFSKIRRRVVKGWRLASTLGTFAAIIFFPGIKMGREWDVWWLYVCFCVFVLSFSSTPGFCHVPLLPQAIHSRIGVCGLCIHVRRKFSFSSLGIPCNCRLNQDAHHM